MKSGEYIDFANYEFIDKSYQDDIFKELSRRVKTVMNDKKFMYGNELFEILYQIIDEKGESPKET